MSSSRECADLDESSVTMVDVLEQQTAAEEDAHAVLGGSDDNECTHSRGYVRRQALYACLTCCPGGNPRAGVCLACSLTCHEKHELVELYTKRDFRCDCGGPKFAGRPCSMGGLRLQENDLNKYNHNFAGLYCRCERPYPDPEGVNDDDMIQCVVCEDWLHAGHLDTRVPNHDRYSEMVCGPCADANPFLKDYLTHAVNPDDEDSTLNETVNVTSLDETLDTSIPIIQSVISTSVATDTPQSPVNPESSVIDKSDNLECSNAFVDTEMNKDKTESTVVQEQAVVQCNNIEIETQSETTDCSKSLDIGSEMVDNKENEGIIREVESPNKNNLEKESTDLEKVSATNLTENHIVDRRETPIENDIGAESKLKIAENSPLSDEKKSTDAIHNIETDKTNEKPVPNSNEDKLDKLNVLKDEAVTSLKMMENDNDICHLENVINAVQTFQSENLEKVDSSNTPNGNENSESINSSVDILTKSNDDLTTTSSVVNENDPESSKSDTRLKANSNIGNGELTDNTEMENSSISTCEPMEVDKIPLSNAIDDTKYIIKSEQNNVPENINEHLKRKIEPNVKLEPIDDDNFSVKKQKMDFVKCVRPSNDSIARKGAIFWPCEWRTKLCTCLTCTEMYKEKNVSFLLDTEDTVIAYENIGKSKTSSSQYEKGLEALSSLDRIQQINAITEYNKMKEKLLEFLKTFKDKREVVREEDIKGFFAGMKPKREPDGVYFCR